MSDPKQEAYKKINEIIGTASQYHYDGKLVAVSIACVLKNGETRMMFGMEPTAVFVLSTATDLLHDAIKSQIKFTIGEGGTIP